MSATGPETVMLTNVERAGLIRALRNAGGSIAVRLVPLLEKMSGGLVIDRRNATTTALVLFLRTAAPGRRFVTVEHPDRHVQAYAHRLGVSISTTRGTLVTGTHAEPKVESSVIVTIISREE